MRNVSPENLHFFSLSSEYIRNVIIIAVGETMSFFNVFSRSNFPVFVEKIPRKEKKTENRIFGVSPLESRIERNLIEFHRETILCTCYDWLLIVLYIAKGSERENTCTCMYIHMPARARMYIYLYSMLSYCYDCFVTIVICHWLLVNDGLRSLITSLNRMYISSFKKGAREERTYGVESVAQVLAHF